MKIIPLNKEHIPAAVKLAAAAHEQERSYVPALPPRKEEDYLSLFQRMVGRFPGMAAFNDGELVGYIIGQKVPGFRSVHQGIHVPEWANAATGSDRYNLIRQLYASIAPEWVANGCLTHAVTLYAHDHVALDTWFRTSFGMICGDAVRELAPVHGSQANDIRIRHACAEDIDLILPLVHEHQRFYPTAPLFMPLQKLADRAELEEWLSRENHVLWLALKQGEPIGYFESSPSHPGARELVASDTTCSVCSAFVRPSARGLGVAASILAEIIHWAKQQGYERCAVDYETHNIYGSRFWERHFQPVALSLMRHVDERVLWAHARRAPDQIW